MDAKDVRIFCEMAFKDPNYASFTDRQVSPTGIGRKLGLDEKTVRVRVENMEERGFLKYHQAMPSLALFGLNNVVLYRFEALNLATKSKLVENIHEVPYVVDALEYLGPLVSVNLAGAS